MTNEIIIYQFTAPSTLKSSRDTFNENNSEWIEDDYPYNLSGNELFMNGYLVGRVENNGANEMIWKTPLGITILSRISKNYTKEIIGIWEGKCITPEENSDIHRWQYKDNGIYSYFFKDTNGNWTEKDDNDSKYILHGNFLITSWYNDDNTGTQGENCEIWDITINKDNMT